MVDASVYTTTGASGQWNYYEVSAAAPEGSTHATVLLTSGAGKGDAYFDQVTLTAGGTTEIAPEEFNGTWNLLYSEDPRLDFDKVGLDAIKAFSTSTAMSAYGYSGAGALNKLLTAADKYAEETELSLTYLGTTTIVFPLHPVLEVKVTTEIDAAHNELLHILVNQGALALLAYLAVLVRALLCWWKNRQELYRLMCGAAVLFYLLQSLFGISSPVSAPFFWMALGCLMSDSKQENLK